jgi:hypothetical protein
MQQINMFEFIPDDQPKQEPVISKKERLAKELKGEALISLLNTIPNDQRRELPFPEFERLPKAKTLDDAMRICCRAVRNCGHCGNKYYEADKFATCCDIVKQYLEYCGFKNANEGKTDWHYLWVKNPE